MKNKKILIYSINLITYMLLIGIIISLLIDKNIIIDKEKQLIKEMTQSENEANLQTQINALNASHNEYATNVQNYKKQIAEAITNQGVTTSADATAEVMAENIGKILTAKTDSTATAAQILSGQTAYVNGVLVTGTMTNRTNKTTAWSGYETIALQAHPSDSSQGLVTITNSNGATGYYDGTSKITGNIANLNAANIKAGVKVGRVDGTSGITGTYTSDATAVAGNILSGRTAYVNGSKVTGTMTSQAGSANVNNDKAWLYSNRVYFGIPTGYYGAGTYGGMSNVSERYITYSSLASAIGLTAPKLAKGQTVLGITGTYTGDATYNVDSVSSRWGSGVTKTLSRTISGKCLIILFAARPYNDITEAPTFNYGTLEHTSSLPGTVCTRVYRYTGETSVTGTATFPYTTNDMTVGLYVINY